MASQVDEKREIERLEDENKVLMERLTGLENELCRRDKSLQEVTDQKERICTDLKETQRKINALQDQLEELEDGEMRAKGLAEKLKASLDEERMKYKRDLDHLHSSLSDFQGHLKDSEINCQQTEEKYHMILTELEEKVDFISQLEKERNQLISDSSSRLANLNQILLLTKQNCSQLEDQNEELEAHQSILLTENETLERRCMELADKLKEPCQFCKKLSAQGTKSDNKEREIPRSFSTPATPFKLLPEHSEIDRLLDENSRLKQKYDCLFANYQMVSEKSSQLKKEFKDMERSLNEIQGICDTLRNEKEELLAVYERTKADLEARQQAIQESHSSMKKHNHMMEQSRSLMDELNEIQSRHDELLTKNSDLQTQLQTAQENVGHLRNQISSLKLEKTDNERSLEDARCRLAELVDELHHYKNSYERRSEEGVANMMILSKENSDSIEACKKDLDCLTKEREKLKERVEKLEAKASELEEEKVTLSATNEDLRSAMDDLEREQKEREQEANERNHEIQESLSRDSLELQTKLDTLGNENRRFSDENSILKSKLNESQTRFKELKNSVSKYRSQLESERNKTSALQIELDSLKSENFLTSEEVTKAAKELVLAKDLLKRFKGDLRDSAEAHAELEDEMMQCRMRIDELETLNFELESSLAEKQSTEVSLVSKRSRIEQELEEVKNKLTVTEEVLYEREKLLNDKSLSCDLLVKENTSLLNQLDQLSQALMEASAREDSLKEQLEHHDRDTQQIALQVAELESIHLHCKPLRDQLEAQLESTKERVLLLEEELAAGRVELSSAKHERKQHTKTRQYLEEKIHELEGRLKTMGLKSEELLALSERQENQLMELTEHTKTKSEQLRASEKENGRLRNEIRENQHTYTKKIEKSETKYYQLQETNDQLATEKSDLSSQVLQLSMQIQELEQDKESTTKEREEFEKKIAILKDDKASLQKELETIQSKWKEAKRDLRYQRKKYEREITYEQQYSHAVNQFKNLRDEALNVLTKPTTTPPSSSSPPLSPDKRSPVMPKLATISEEDMSHPPQNN